MTRIILLIISLSMLFLKSYGQSNDYFNNNESWSSQHYGTPGYPPHNYYAHQIGNTALGGETFVKLKQVHAYEGMSADTNFLLGKSNSGKLNLYETNSDFLTLGDSTIYDYSRTDSITKHSYVNSAHNYEAWQIVSMDTIYFGAIARKIFTIEPNSSCFVYEGVPGFYINLFEFANLLKCYSSSGTTYSVNYNVFTAISSDNCIIEDLGLDETFSHEKTLLRIVDLMGRLTIEKPNEILFYIYDNGTTEKKIRME